MADATARLEQFRKMAEADPNNELGHFSLGQELLKAGDFADAEKSFARVLELNPNLSRAWQYQATAQKALGKTDQSIATLTRGVQIAHERGENMPKDEMIKMLQDAGAKVPEFASAAAPALKAVGTGQVQCSRCGNVAAAMAHAPFSNAQGREIQSKVCADCWQQWIRMGTKVINELRLPLNDPSAQKIFDQHMREFLNL
jgi:Fe-S cluster biosynthesis and repair protein YggX